MKIKILRKYLFITVLFMITVMNACKKFVEVPAPTTSLNSASVFTDDATAASAITGIYTDMSSPNIQDEGFLGLSLYAGLSADELTLGNLGNLTMYAYYTNDLKRLAGGSTFWVRFFPEIYKANAAIESLNSSNSLTPAVKQQLLGEAKFIRAFFNFYLVNLYGDIPLPLTSDYKENAKLPKTPTLQIYKQIITDLKDAELALSGDYVMGDASTKYPVGSEERVRPTKGAAAALLARAYLYFGNLTKDQNIYGMAETEASSVINDNHYKLNVDLNSVFLRNNTEAIWQLQPVWSNRTTSEATLFILPASGPDLFSNPVVLSQTMVASFETNDLRKTNWISSVNAGGTTYYYVTKYKNSQPSGTFSEYSTVLRLAEQYLIRAEARAMQNDLGGARSDLNIIRNRAGLPNIVAVTQQDVLSAILQERKVELFTEFGHRWLDLKRSGTIDNVMSPITASKGGTWTHNWALYPIPLVDINANPNLKGQQNPGY